MDDIVPSAPLRGAAPSSVSRAGWAAAGATWRA
jgi:hypothetical protein